MATYEKCPKAVIDLAADVMKEFHKPLVGKVRIDYLFAHGERDENNNVVSPAIIHGGYQAIGITRKLSLKDRVKGCGDAEIVLDAVWWNDTATDEQQKALVDHGLQHIAITDKSDAIGRPVLKLRKHDVQVGWFRSVAERQGVHSMERIQAAQIMEQHGQYFWPEISGTKSRMQKLEIPSRVITQSSPAT